jgi:adenosylhomocysteinase
MEGLEVTVLDKAVESADVIITATGVVGVVTVDHFRRLKNNAIVANMASDDDVSPV